uniref:uncharacterized protein LOC120330980 n=1 Tax=Styela clava TaxID=7725 RepID=UPI0019397546|nr:uncharacterized protein LOC120330980 [Styela clava]
MIGNRTTGCGQRTMERISSLSISSTPNYFVNYTNSSTTDRGESNSFTSIWDICFISSSLMMFCNAWIAVAFILYAKSSNILVKRSRTDMDGGFIFKVAIASVVLPLSKFATTLLILVVGLYPENHTACSVIIYVSNVLLVASVLAVYLFLWIRQRAFYTHPSLGSIFNRCIARFSKMSLLMIVLPILTSMIVDMVTNKYESGVHGCVFRNDQDDNNYRFFIYAAILTVGQGSLIGLFVYPICIHAKSQSEMASERSETFISKQVESRTSLDMSVNASFRIGTAEETQNTSIALQTIDGTSTAKTGSFMTTIFTKRKHIDNGDSHVRVSVDEESETSQKAARRGFRKGSKIYLLVKRTLYLACISILSDILGMGISGLLVPKGTPYYVVCVLLDVDIIVNTITVVGSFRNWHQILFGRFMKFFEK